MTTVREFLKDTKSHVSRGLPSSRKLHNPKIRQLHIVARRDWFDAKEEQVEVAANGAELKIAQAMMAVRAFGLKFRPWLRRGKP